MYAYTDIETLPTEDPELIAELTECVSPPGNMSKAETIAKWEAESKPALVEEVVRKTALDGSFGRICAIGYAFDDMSPQVFISADERTVLGGFFAALQAQAQITEGGQEYERNLVFVGHNLSSFDLRFIWQRAVVLGLRPPAALRRAAQGKPWSGLIEDTMLMWNPERDRRISMDRLCRALGVPSPKDDLDGSKVYDAWKAGELERIADYCKAEIRALRACHRRMLFLESAA